MTYTPISIVSPNETHEPINLLQVARASLIVNWYLVIICIHRRMTVFARMDCVSVCWCGGNDISGLADCLQCLCWAGLWKASAIVNVLILVYDMHTHTTTWKLDSSWGMVIASGVGHPFSLFTLAHYSVCTGCHSVSNGEPHCSAKNWLDWYAMELCRELVVVLQVCLLWVVCEWYVSHGQCRMVTARQRHWILLDCDRN